ncbi:glycoside hydrolase family 13 protein [Hamadaea tsunoensis]|uniref:glycoside hydrolase family 13 protein n=1 Tax=Hamadaea tsunoensis TaxID=53368 RepID=UPI000417FB96|nr:glycoside hydrolase family 13 protein [Hamadaea tsunoensis]
MPSLFHQPHHDGSALYVADPAPALGDLVTVRVRVPAGAGVSEVWVRTTPDAEPRFTQVRHDGGEWWSGLVEVRNPVTNYRFYLLFDERESGGRPPAWLTAAGIVADDVPDATDFRLVAYAAPPSWPADAVVYQIFPDRFARSAAAGPVAEAELPDWALPCDWDTTEVLGRGPGVSEQFFGGDLDGITGHLDHIEALGVNTVYLTPVFPARSNHRYNASTFDRIDPLLGGDEAYQRLAHELHARGLRLVGDITTNHCGDGHEWFVSASDPKAPEREMFFFGPEYGLAEDEYESWNGVRSLPKLNWASPLTREWMLDVLRKWLRPLPDGSPAPLDGWRVDVANMTGRRAASDLTHEVAALLRTEIAAVRPDALLVAEHMHDATGDLDRDGWHGTMNYAGFTRPVWSWLVAEGSPAEFFGVPGGVPSRPAESAVATMRAFAGRTSWRALVNSWTPLDSHDSARMRTVAGSRQRHLVAVGLQMTLPGTPMIFAGDEFGLTGWNGENSRTPMPWNRPADRDPATLDAYTSLIGLRNDEPALRHGGLRWVYAEGDALAFLRETAAGSLLVLARRAAGAAVELAGLGGGVNLYGGLPLSGGALPASDGPTLQVWRLAG